MDKIVKYNEYNINTHDFESSKNKIKNFSEKTKAIPELSTVRTSGGLFDLFSHKVTGDELNEVTSQIQDYLISFNSLLTDFIEQFGEVYKTFEALDNDYIKGILISIESIKKTNDELKVAQKDIRKTIEVQKKTIKALSVFKEQLKKLKHLGDIDAIWLDISKAQRELASIETDIKSAKTFIKDNSEVIKTLVQFKTRTDKIAHLKDLDKLWDDFKTSRNKLSSIEKDIDNIYKKAEGQSEAIAVLCDFKDRTDGLNHLDDVDEMWSNVEKLRIIAEKTRGELKDLHDSISTITEHIDGLSEFQSNLERTEHLCDIDELWNKCFGNQTDIARIDETVKSQQNRIEFLNVGFNDNISNHQQQIDKLNEDIEREAEKRHNESEKLKNSIIGDINNQQEIIKALAVDISKHQQELKDLGVTVTDNKENQQTEIEALKIALSEMRTATAEKENTYTKKLQIAYVVSGCGLGMAVIELILFILKVL